MRSFFLIGLLAAALGSCSGKALVDAAKDYDAQAQAALATRTAIDARRAGLGLPPLYR